MTQDNQSTLQDEWLAAFANQILDGNGNDLSTVNSDSEMRALAETILRLNHAFPKESVNPATAKRIQARVLARWRDEEQKKARWSNFFAQFRRPQFALTLAIVAGIGILIVVAPILLTGGGLLTASAGSEASLDIIAVIVLGVLFVVAIWWLRRKK